MSSSASTEDGLIRIWDSRQGNPLAVLEGRVAAANVLSQNRDGRLASGGGDTPVNRSPAEVATALRCRQDVPDHDARAPASIQGRTWIGGRTGGEGIGPGTSFIPIA